MTWLGVHLGAQFSTSCSTRNIGFLLPPSPPSSFFKAKTGIWHTPNCRFPRYFRRQKTGHGSTLAAMACALNGFRQLQRAPLRLLREADFDLSRGETISGSKPERWPPAVGHNAPASTPSLRSLTATCGALFRSIRIAGGRHRGADCCPSG